MAGEPHTKHRTLLMQLSGAVGRLPTWGPQTEHIDYCTVHTL